MKGEKRIAMVARRLPDGRTECVITDTTIPGARVVGTMKASMAVLQVGKSKIRMALIKEKKKPEPEPKGKDDDKK